jgi:alanyl-tRNA synthetase
MDFLLKKDRGVEQGDPQINSLISSIKESNKKHFEIYVTDRENDHSKDIALSIKEGKNVVFEIAKAEYSTYLRCYVPNSDLSSHSYNAESILELSKNNNVIGRDDFAAIRYDAQTDVKDILRDVERVVEKMPDIAPPKDPKREDPPR